MLSVLEKPGEWLVHGNTVTLSCDLVLIVYVVNPIILNSQVYALSSSTGEVIWTSPALDGMCEGTAHVTSDDANVFVIHNSASSTVGHFSVLDATDGTSIFTYDDTSAPFSPMGFYPDPSPGGNYPVGTGNTNSVAIWSNKPTPTATEGESGGTFAFQMPPSTSVGTPSVTVLVASPNIAWRSTAPPLLAAMGQEMFWCVSRSQLKAAPYTPAVNNMETPSLVCGGAADSSFSCMEPVGDPYTLSWTNNFTGVIAADPLFSTGGDRIYYVPDDGIFYSVNPEDGTEFWNAPTTVIIEANFALTSDGAYLFLGDTTGNILAWQVAESELGTVTTPPGSSPTGETGMPVESPSSGPETEMPTMTEAPASTPGAPSPTAPSPTSSGAPSMAVFSVITATVVAVIAFF